MSYSCLLPLAFCLLLFTQISTMTLKISHICPITLLLIVCLTQLAAQQQGPRFFHYHEIAGQQKTLRKGALEHVVIAGNNTPDGDRRIIDTLKMFLGENVIPGSPTLWPNYHRVIKNLQIRGADWSELPVELSGFHHLFDLSFVKCPNITLQRINDQIKKRSEQDKHDPLYKKFKNDIVSLIFSDTDFATLDSCHLEVELMEELRELRFVRIGNFNHHCENLLNELNRAYPSLGWLTIEGCELDNKNNLLPLREFKELKSVSLSRNYLSEIPAVPESLRALDISYNFLSDFPDTADSISLKKLEFLYLECNLFDYFKLYKVLTDSILNKMDVFSYDPCNFDTLEELKLISHALDKRKVAAYMPFVERYHNDFSPAVPDCDRCYPHRDQFISKLLEGVTFLDSIGTENQISLETNGNRMMLRAVASTESTLRNRVYMYKQLKNCIRNYTDPADISQIWDWQLSFWVEDPASMQNHLKKLVVRLKGKTGQMHWEEMEDR